MNRKIITAVILGILSALLIPVVSLAATTQIGTKADLLALADRVNGGDTCYGETFELTADIQVDGAWTPIGVNGNPFNGTFDGKGFKVTGYTSSVWTRAGFFSLIDVFGAVINTDFYGDVSTNGLPGSTAGGIAAMNCGTIMNCSFSGSVSSFEYSGGLVAENLGLVRNCFSAGTVDAIISAGGIAGIINPVSDIQNCYSTATVTGPSPGGLVGYFGTGQMNNSYWLLSGCANGCGGYYAGTVTNMFSFGSSGILSSPVGGSNVLLDVLNAYAQPDPNLIMWTAGMGEYKYPVLEPSVYEIQAAPAGLDFGTAVEGYTQPAAQIITVTNAGNLNVAITQPTATNYTVGALSATSIAPAGIATFTVQPKAGLVVGTYDDTISITGSNSVSASVQLTFTVTEAPVYGISVSPLLKNFGIVPEGYTPPGLETITLTNTGNQPVTITQPTAANYTVGALSLANLDPAGTASFTVQPKAGLASGIYTETIAIAGTGGVSSAVQVSFTVVPPTVYPITAGANGTYHQQGPSGLTFRASGDFSHFTGITVDGNLVDESSYDAREGSTIITLHPDYLDTLTPGTHQIRIHFTDGYADASFTVAEELDPVMPPTGDNGEAILWGILAILCAAALMSLGACRRMANR